MANRFSQRWNRLGASQIVAGHGETIRVAAHGETDPENYDTITNALIGNWATDEQSLAEFGPQFAMETCGVEICVDDSLTEYCGRAKLSRTDQVAIDSVFYGIKDLRTDRVGWQLILLERPAVLSVGHQMKQGVR